MSQAEAPEIRIFRPGTFTSMEGVDVSFTEADMRAIAAAYDAENAPAPLVVGHPRTDDPAWGWVGALSVNRNGELVATPRDVEPSFAETVRARRYRKVSASLYPPDASNNPRPGSYYLKHVGFLGAAAPAVSGLGTVHFSEGDDALTIIETETTMPNPAEKKDELNFAEREAALHRREQEFEAREKAAREAVAKGRHEAAVSFAEGLVSAGKLKPAGKDLVVSVLDALDAEAAVSFAEPGEMTLAAVFRKLLDDAEPMISFVETMPPEKRGSIGGTVSFAAPDGAAVDPVGLDLYRRAKALQVEHPALSFQECVRRVLA